MFSPVSSGSYDVQTVEIRAAEGVEVQMAHKDITRDKLGERQCVVCQLTWFLTTIHGG